MLRKGIVLLGLILTVFIVSCAAPEDKSVNETIIDPESALDKEAALPAEEGDCPGRFICISSLVSAYQDKDCQIVNRTTCETECADGVCREKEIRICPPGFKCRNQYSRGFQREDCSWDKTEKCEFGCNLNTTKCFNSSQVDTAIPTPTEKAASKSVYPVIQQNQIVDISSEDLTIYAIEADRVQLRLGPQKSNWLGEGDSATFKNGVTVTVREILFQAYAGGKKEVVYSVS